MSQKLLRGTHGPKVRSGGGPDRGAVKEGLNIGSKRKSCILGFRAAPGARETLQTNEGRSPPPFWRVSRAFRAARNPQIPDLRLNAVFQTLFCPSRGAAKDKYGTTTKDNKLNSRTEIHPVKSAEVELWGRLAPRS